MVSTPPRAGLSLWIAGCIAWCGTVACHYRFSGGGVAPLGVELLSVEPFRDQTTEGELGALVATAVRRELARRRPELVAGLGQRDAARVIGRVEAVSQQTIPVARGHSVAAGLYRMRVIASAELRSPGGSLLVDLGQFSEDVEVPVEAGVSASEEARQRALQRACRDLGVQVAEALLLGL